MSMEAAAAAIRLQQVKAPSGRKQLTNAQLIAEAQVLATLAVAQELRVANAIAAAALGTSGLDMPNPAQAKGEPTRLRQERMKLLREIIRDEFGITDGTER